MELHESMLFFTASFLSNKIQKPYAAMPRHLYHSSVEPISCSETCRSKVNAFLLLSKAAFHQDGTAELIALRKGRTWKN